MKNYFFSKNKNKKKPKTYNFHIITEKLHVQEIVQNNSNYVHTV